MMHWDVVFDPPGYPAGTVLIDGLPFTRLENGALRPRFSVFPDGSIKFHLAIGQNDLG